MATSAMHLAALTAVGTRHRMQGAVETREANLVPLLTPPRSIAESRYRTVRRGDHLPQVGLDHAIVRTWIAETAICTRSQGLSRHHRFHYGVVWRAAPRL